MSKGEGAAFRRKLKFNLTYKQKLFLPIAAMVWLLIIVFAIFQLNRTRQLKREVVLANVEIINHRIMALYEHNEDIRSFIKFIDDYFDNSLYSEVSVSVYDAVTGEVIADMGFNAPAPSRLDLGAGTVSGETLNRDEESDADLDPTHAFYYKETTSPDGAIIAQTILPMNIDIEKRISGGILWWILIVLAGVIMTIVIYLTTSHVARNVKILREFADRAADGRPIETVENFGSDDLGDIGRRIVAIYSERAAANNAREIEHKVALKATEERSNLKRQLTNNISHELKTPVGVIRGYIDTLVENPDMDESSRMHFLTKTQEHVDRLCNLLNDLSTMTRLDEASAKIPMEGINMKSLVASIAKDVEESGMADGMDFVVDIPDDCIVKGNASLLTGAIMNLVKNAINYSHGSEMGVKLLTRNVRVLTFVFYDNGTGVEPEHLPHLFDRFYRVDKGRSRKVGGTGLGLPIVRSSLNSMGGQIAVRNGAESGLEFVFSLPAFRPPRPAKS